MYCQCSKNSFPVKFPPKIFFWKNFIAPKDSSLNLSGSLLSYFWASVLISAVISILDDFGNLLPARTVTVKPYLNSVLGHKLILILSLHGAGFFISNLHIKCNCHYFSLNIIFRDYKSYIIKKYASYSNYIQIKWWLIRNDTDSVVKSSYSVLKCLNITL